MGAESVDAVVGVSVKGELGKGAAGVEFFKHMNRALFIEVQLLEEGGVVLWVSVVHGGEVREVSGIWVVEWIL